MLRRWIQKVESSKEDVSGDSTDFKELEVTLACFPSSLLQLCVDSVPFVGTDLCWKNTVAHENKRSYNTRISIGIDINGFKGYE